MNILCSQIVPIGAGGITRSFDEQRLYNYVFRSICEERSNLKQKGSGSLKPHLRGKPFGHRLEQHRMHMREVQIQLPCDEFGILHSLKKQVSFPAC